MNNNYLGQMDDGIGIDPTTLDVIESLDDSTPSPAASSPTDKKLKTPKKEKEPKAPKQKKEKKVNPDAKPGDGQKKFLLIVLVIALIGGVGYGIYWYLNLGTTNNKNNNEKKYILNDVYVTVDDILSDSISDYGEFPGVDLKTCSLDTGSVKMDVVGDYPYYITCEGTKYNATIHVLDVPVFDFDLNLAVTNVDGNLDLYSLFTSSESYTPSIVDEDELEDALSTPGFKNISFNLSNEYGQMLSFNGIIYVIDDVYDSVLTCHSSEQESNDRKYVITDTVYYSVAGEKIGLLSSYKFTLDSEDIKQALSDISLDGIITFNSITGYAIIDEENSTLTIYKENENSSIDEKTEKEAKDYYVDTRSYTCE